MNYRDTLVTCQECGTEFVFTVEKQRQMAEKGLEVAIPEMCNACTQRVQYGGKLHGRIKWFNMEKGWGFIVQDNGSEIFVHRDGLLPTQGGTLPQLPDGQEVLYDLFESAKGPQAVKVTLYPEQTDAS